MIKVGRPRVDIVPHTADTPPQLWVGTHRYEFDDVTALYFMSVLTHWIYYEAHKAKGPSFALKGDKDGIS